MQPGTQSNEEVLPPWRQLCDALAKRAAGDGALADHLVDEELADWVRRKLAGDRDHPEAREVLKSLFIYSGWSQARIARRFGIGRQRVGDAVKEGGWTRAVPLAPLPPQPSAERRRPTAALSPSRRTAIVRRFYRLLEAKMKQLETQMAEAAASGVPQSPADAERELRAATNLAQLYQKIEALEKEAKGEADKDATARSEEDADSFRRDLALRLQRLDRDGEG